MKPTNVVFILPDQFSRDMAGCYGNAICRTPNIDALAERGVRYSRAYCNSPICIPARAALASGRYIHETGNWDNAHPYNGSTPSWHHRIREAGYTVDAIGKLHFRSKRDDNGFNTEINTMHMVSGTAPVVQCLRGETGTMNKRKEVDVAGPGDSSYLRYDAANTDTACTWISDHSGDTRPWALFLGLVSPHPPMIAPRELFDYYLEQALPMPPQWREEEWPPHPSMVFLRRYLQFHKPVDAHGIKRFIAAYYGLCEFVDRQVGKVLRQLERSSLTDSTRIIFASDHGEARGARGVFGKFNFREESVAVPLIVSGPAIPKDKVVATPVSLVDLYPTILDFFQIQSEAEERSLPGRPITDFLDDPGGDRTVFGEYHAIGSKDALYMLCDLHHKFIYHVGKRAELFDLVADPAETVNLADRPEHERLVKKFERRLRAIVDPEETDRRAKADQIALVERSGGADAVRARGTFENTPVPGEDPVIYRGA